jgi:hypothetical protein
MAVLALSGAGSPHPARRVPRVANTKPVRAGALTKRRTFEGFIEYGMGSRAVEGVAKVGIKGSGEQAGKIRDDSGGMIKEASAARCRKQKFAGF